MRHLIHVNKFAVLERVLSLDDDPAASPHGLLTNVTGRASKMRKYVDTTSTDEKRFQGLQDSGLESPRSGASLHRDAQQLPTTIKSYSEASRPFMLKQHDSPRAELRTNMSVALQGHAEHLHEERFFSLAATRRSRFSITALHVIR